MERYFSSVGVVAFSDHDEDLVADDGVVDDCINEATEELANYLTQRYDHTALASSHTVIGWATKVACYFLCLRRGNPAPQSISEEFNRILNPDDGLAIRVSRGNYQIRGLALRDDQRPTWSNLRIDRRWPNSKTRVTRTNSSDAPTDLTQDDSYTAPTYHHDI